MVNITLLRHGKPTGGRYFRGTTDDPLSEQGLAQMQQALAIESWDNIISSPLKRCQQFASSLARPFNTNPDWQEIHFGEWEGQSYDQIKTAFGDSVDHYWQDPSQYTPPQAESVHDFQTRTIRALRQLISLNKPNNLVITHGGNIRVILAHIIGVPWQRFAFIDVPYACVSKIRYHNLQFHLLSHNAS